MLKKDLVSIRDLRLRDLRGIFTLAGKVKKQPHKFNQALKGKTLALVFEKPSNRTQVSFQVGMYQLGGNSIYLGPEGLGLGVRESTKDAAKTLSRYVDGIVLRTFSHKTILEMAGSASVPLINGLSDLLHPCQIISDLFTIKEKFGKFKRITLVYVGDGNNICHSLLYGCSKVGLNLNIATPRIYSPSPGILQESKSFAKKSKTNLVLFEEACDAVKGADIVYTDVWTSMGREKEAAQRKRYFKNFQLNKKLLSFAKRKCLIMHCLPAHHGEEITDGVMESPNSIVFDQAENRLHVQKAILMQLLLKVKSERLKA